MSPPIKREIMVKPKNKTRRYKRTGRFRSNFELLISKQLNDYGAKWKYELVKYPYYSPSRNTIVCENCGPCNGLLLRHYLPDFFLSNGVVIEGKGRLVASDRAKLEAIRRYHPDLDLRILFQYDRKYNARGDRYTDWANKANIPSAVGTIPVDWLQHSDQEFPRTWRRTLFPPPSELAFPSFQKSKRRSRKV